MTVALVVATGASVLAAGLHSARAGDVAPVSDERSGADRVPRETSVKLLASLRESWQAGVPKSSRACEASSYTYGSARGLSRVREAVRQGHRVTVLAVGSSSTVGVGASEPSLAYPARLDAALDRVLDGYPVDVVARGVSGEAAETMSERIKLEVARNRPQLVIWQVGTNAAIQRMPTAKLADLIERTVAWLAAKNVDVVLVDPQFTDKLSQDAHYVDIVRTIFATALKSDVAIVRRYSAMSEYASRGMLSAYLARDQFHHNDLGYQCLTEHVLGTLVHELARAEVQARQFASRQDGE
ncbi:MAG: SGNH/GDSL hydrolase family protein [Hyphomicrobiaceae bacterium]